MTVEAQSVAGTSIDPATHLGLLSLSVADLERSLAFYTEAIGFEILRRDAAEATLGAAGTPLLLLTEEARAAVVSRLEAAGLPCTWTGDLVAVQDPWQNTILLQVGRAADNEAAARLAAGFQELGAPVS